MIFEWDAAKSARNARERGLPFDVAMAIFDRSTLEAPDVRRDYGESRIKAVGVVQGVALVCVYSDRNAVRRIISLRIANRKERHAYRAAYPG
ncbi:MAG TPA: BrnT family toxin [Rhizomicrobium sp.]|jgi:hypothetical protein|nr:BrnT family toxin [Rhizomicrobium sp.]